MYKAEGSRAEAVEMPGVLILVKIEAAQYCTVLGTGYSRNHPNREGPEEEECAG